MPLPGSDLQTVLNLGSYVFEASGSGIREGGHFNKPRALNKAWLSPLALQN